MSSAVSPFRGPIRRISRPPGCAGSARRNRNGWNYFGGLNIHYFEIFPIFSLANEENIGKTIVPVENRGIFFGKTDKGYLYISRRYGMMLLVAQYPSQSAPVSKKGLKILLRAYRSGWVLGVKVSGRGVTAYTDRPGFRGDLLLCDSRSVSAGTRTAYEAGLNLHCGAQNRVLCVA